MKPTITGLESRLATKPSRSTPASRQITPTMTLRPAGEQGKTADVAQGDRHQNDGHDGGHRRVRADDEAARAAEQRVGQQGQHAAIESRQRQAGQLAIGEPHRHHHCAERQSRRQIVRQERRLVGSQHCQTRHEACDVHSISPHRADDMT